ncbi:MAG: hypothetical protein PHU25_15345 [Deltaproteobacteria bacterium]|nr:hypothetical protein [Deltaproteobacteria bacterium]
MKRVHESHDPAYMELANIARRASARKMEIERSGATPSVDVSDLVRWCATYGLLGLLPHRVIEVVLPHQETESGYRQMRYIRGVDGWTESDCVTLKFEKPLLHRRRPKRRLTFVQTSNSIPAASMTISGSPSLAENVYMVLDGAPTEIHFPEGSVAESLDRTWARSFERDEASVGDVASMYPKPNSDGFWQRYREPVGDILRIGDIIAGVVDHAIAFKEKTAPRDVTTRRHEDTLYLGRFLIGVQPTLLIKEEGQVVEGWAYFSFLGVMGLMMRYDLTNPRVTFKRCERDGCTNTYRAFRQDELYCSKKCKDVVAQRKVRQKRSSPTTNTAATKRRPGHRRIAERHDGGTHARNPARSR